MHPVIESIFSVMASTTMRKFLIFASGFIAAFSFFFFTGALNRLSQRPVMRPLDGQGFLPKSPHSHGEFDEFMNRKGRMQPLKFEDHEEHSHVGEDLIAKELYKKVRVFCWILTNPKNHKTKAVHVKATWAKRCNKYLFMSSEDDPFLPAHNLRVAEGRDHLWGKTKAAFKYLYEHEADNFDFFMKADDDTYVVLENLRYMLRNVDPNDPRLYGRRFKPFVKQGYMSGGAGYVISRGGLKALMSKGFNNLPNCRRDEGGAEDVHFGQCAEAAGVKAHDSRDSLGRERFHPFPPYSHLKPIEKGNWLWSYNFYPLKTGPECCSDTSIAYHYIAPDDMYFLEYFVYHWRPYGIVRDVNDVRRFFGYEKTAPKLDDKDRQEAQAELEKARVLRGHAEQLKRDAAEQLQQANQKAEEIKSDARKEAKKMLEEVRKREEAKKAEAKPTVSRRKAAEARTEKKAEEKVPLKKAEEKVPLKKAEEKVPLKKKAEKKNAKKL